jgi:hypothetical protein
VKVTFTTFILYKNDVNFITLKQPSLKSYEGAWGEPKLGYIPVIKRKLSTALLVNTSVRGSC